MYGIIGNATPPFPAAGYTAGSFANRICDARLVRAGSPPPGRCASRVFFRHIPGADTYICHEVNFLPFPDKSLIPAKRKVVR